MRGQLKDVRTFLPLFSLEKNIYPPAPVRRSRMWEREGRSLCDCSRGLSHTLHPPPPPPPLFHIRGRKERKEFLWQGALPPPPVGVGEWGEGKGPLQSALAGKKRREGKRDGETLENKNQKTLLEAFWNSNEVRYVQRMKKGRRICLNKLFCRV